MCVHVSTECLAIVAGGATMALLTYNCAHGTGYRLGANDLMIASIAPAGSDGLDTRNWDEFSRVPGCDVELW